MYILDLLLDVYTLIPYSRKIWRGIKFGSLAVYYYNRQIKIRQNFLLAHIRMAIPYRTAKFKSANILSIAILGSTAKFNARQYFRLYGTCIYVLPTTSSRALASMSSRLYSMGLSLRHTYCTCTLEFPHSGHASLHFLLFRCRPLNVHYNVSAPLLLGFVRSVQAASVHAYS